MSLTAARDALDATWRQYGQAKRVGAALLAETYKKQAEKQQEELAALEVQGIARMRAARIPSADARAYKGRYHAAVQCALAELDNDDELKGWAQQRAKEAEDLAATVGDDVMLQTATLRQHWHRWGLPPPDLTTQRTPQGVRARLGCALAWRRAARKAWAQLKEAKAIQEGRVHRRAGLYLSDAMFRHLRQRKADSREMLEKLSAISDEGEIIDLVDAIDASLANPRVRRIDTMDWAGALDRLAELRGDVAMFETLTAASRWHAHTWKAKQVAKNPAWQRAGQPMPDAVQAHMAQQWDKAVRELRKKGIGWYGMRTVQPHHDGTPHWHCLIFCKKQHVSRIHQTLRKHFLDSDCPNEPGAEERRVVLKMIDRSKGSAVGYVARYIARAIDGKDCREVSERDDDGIRRKTANDSITGAQRATAWANLWRIRMFQFFGLPSKLWARELRRVDGCEDWTLERHRQAADLAGADGFAEFMDLCAGPMTARKARPLKTWRVAGERLNRYEEPRPDDVKGVQINFDFLAPKPVAPRFGQMVGFAIPPAALPKMVRQHLKCQHAQALDRWESQKAAYQAPRALTRPRTWTLAILEKPVTAAQRARQDQAWKTLSQDLKASAAFVFSSEGEAVAPWKTVNNCSAAASEPANLAAEIAEDLEPDFLAVPLGGFLDAPPLFSGLPSGLPSGHWPPS